MAKDKKWAQWNMYKREHEDIEFVTSAGINVILKFKGGEYRAFNKDTNEDMRLGATVPDNLIEYIKRKF